MDDWVTKILNEWNLPKMYRPFVEVMSTRITSSTWAVVKYKKKCAGVHHARTVRIFCYLGNSKGEIGMAAIQLVSNG